MGPSEDLNSRFNKFFFPKNQFETMMKNQNGMEKSKYSDLALSPFARLVKVFFTQASMYVGMQDGPSCLKPR